MGYIANIQIQVGNRFQVIPPGPLPPVGTRIAVHKHLTEDGTSLVVEVVSHEWTLDESTENEARETVGPMFGIIIRTRTVPR